MKSIIIHIILIVFVSIQLQAQKSNVRLALQYYQSQKWDSAKIYIDSAKIHDETIHELSTYYYSGFIYKELYNNLDKENKQSNYREVALSDHFYFLKENKDPKQNENVLKSIKFLVSTYYNDAVTSLNINEYLLAIQLFDKYKELMLKADPSSNLKDLDIKFHLVLGNIYSELYDLNKGVKNEFFNQVKNTFEYVLEKDSNNWSANYNLGIHYYNEAVNKIKYQDFDLDLISIELIQDEAIELFKKALPYMQKAYELNPKKKETLIGLAGIYFSLNDSMQSEKYNNELKLLENK